MKSNPIIIIDDDEEDFNLFKEVCNELNIKNKIIVLDTAYKAFEYLQAIDTQPFFIICDVNMPMMNGIELRQKINENKYLCIKAVPFLFWSTSGSESLVNEAYSLNIQGFFKKPDSTKELKQIIITIMTYWDCSYHPLT